MCMRCEARAMDLVLTWRRNGLSVVEVMDMVTDVCVLTFSSDQEQEILSFLGWFHGAVRDVYNVTDLEIAAAVQSIKIDMPNVIVISLGNHNLEARRN